MRNKRNTQPGMHNTSLMGLYIAGHLNTGDDQVVIAAGEGPVVANDINKRLLEIYAGG